MNKINRKDSKRFSGLGGDRRMFLKILVVIGVMLAVQGLILSDLFAASAKIELEDPSYEKLYNSRKGYYMRDPKWIKMVTPRLTWPKKGERVPPLICNVISVQTSWVDFMRKVSQDGKKLGLEYDLRMMSVSRWLSPGHDEDIHLHPSIMRPERIDPAEWLVSRAFGLDRRNSGEWVNKEYDRIIRLQSGESDPQNRLKYIYEAQKILAEDFHIAQFGWGPTIVQPYNSADWEGVVLSKGFGIISTDMFWTFINIKPKTPRKRLMYGVVNLIKTTNIFAAGHRFRSIGRMIYDRLAYLDKDLKIIPWAAESWVRVDDRTWDLKLRGGMKFHDGRPVTVDDLKFTMDFCLKYDRGNFWTANRFLESTEIKDRSNRIVRFRFKRPYGQFETYFLLLNIILPKHLFEGIMAKQKAGDDSRLLKIPRPIGSGPFKMAHYKKDQEMLLIANKEHFAAPKIDSALFIVLPSTDSILGQLETQEIDLAEISLSPTQVKQIKKFKHLSIIRTPDIRWFHGAPRTSLLPWRDIEFRRAWHHSIDRNFLVKVIWEGEGRIPASNTFLVDGNPWHNPNLPPILEYDLKKARQILKDAGYSWDKKGRLLYPPPTDKKFIERVTRVCKEGYTWGGLKMLPKK